MPGDRLQSPLWDLIPINRRQVLVRTKEREEPLMRWMKGSPERDRSVSLTISEFKGAFHGGSSAFVYDWIDDAHGDSDPE
jgi:hypothetical protein